MFGSLSLLAQAVESRTEVRMEWLHAPEAWVIFLIIIPAVVLLTFGIYRGERGNLTPFRRGVLTFLRVACVLAIVTFLFEPILTKERVQRANSYVLVLIDDSFSMGIQDRYGDPSAAQGLSEVMGSPFGDDTTRLDLVRGLLQNRDLAFIERLRRQANVRLVACSDGVRKIADLGRLEDGDDPDLTPLDLGSLDLRGKVTRIGDSIYEAVNDLRGETIAAVVLLSDGRDNGGVMAPEEAAARLAKRQLPIHAVGVGNPDEPKDIRLFGLQVAEVVLQEDLVPVDFSLISEGFDGRRPEVKLTLIDRESGGTGIRSPIIRQFELTGGGEEQTHRLQFKPRRAGKYMVRVEVEHLDGELFEENNFEEKPITVLSQKINVLYVDGPPRWEYRYLTWGITRDPTMEAHVFLTSADPEFIQESSAGLTPVASFPRTKEELFEYHLVIIGDVPETTFTAEQKEWLLEFVEEIGGGVVFIAGPWYMPQKYLGDPLERLFPVELEEVDIFSDGSDSRDPFYMKLTPEGLEHPVMLLMSDKEQNQQLWEGGKAYPDSSLPGFYWYAPTKQLKRGGVALAEHEDARHIKYGKRAIFAYQYLGRGRTFVSLVDSTWRWRRQVGNKWFYRFWGQVIRFTSFGRLLGDTPRFTVHTDQREYTLGSTIRITAKVLDREFKPTKEDEIKVFMTRVDSSGMDDTRQEISASQIPARPAHFEATVEALELGEHRVWLEDRGKEVASHTFRVVVPQLEYAEPRLDRPRLQGLAAVSGGAYYEMADAGEIPDRIVAYTRDIPIQSEFTSLWDTPWFLLLFVAIITLEWVLRKAFRLL